MPSGVAKLIFSLAKWFRLISIFIFWQVVPTSKEAVAFNNTVMEYPRQKTVIDLLEEQVAKTPDNIAVIFENKQLTYRELNEKANQLANLTMQ